MPQSANSTNIATRGIARSIFRWIHLICAIPIVGYIYSPFEKLPDYAVPTRYVFLPVMVFSGLWMWKGHLVRKLISKRSAA
jgi:thiosulfate reductase cytochrome b subunit